MAPGSIFHHIIFLSICYFCRRLFCNLYFPIYIIKIPKIFILLTLLDLTFAIGHEGMTTPLSRWLQGSYLFVQVQGDLRVTSYWIDTLVLKNRGKYLCYCAASSLPLRGKSTQARDVALTKHIHVHNQRSNNMHKGSEHIIFH